MRLAIVGSRTFDDYRMMCEYISYIMAAEHLPEITEIISGGARGADSLAERYAEGNNIPTRIFRADWDRFGKSAGIIRNRDIINTSDVVIAFWDEQSHGTEFDIRYAKQTAKPCYVCIFRNK